ncbi:MAG: helix-turn-helix transcriptional regulator [Lachnospiraceae bacterium]|nr:helix-turn-helix transcriptional regulator [Lachnospiraceae bacterium]
MMCAYDRLYLEKARTALGRMFDYAVYELKYDLTEFFALFLATGMARRFERGDAEVLVGKSGVELAYDVCYDSEVKIEFTPFRGTSDRSPEYWAGWALAYYQWKTALPFSEIVQAVPLETIVSLYSPYHEMDIRQFVDKMNELYRAANPETRLKRFRKRAGVSQSELAELSGVPVRTIQQYEQRQKNINKAAAESLVNMARVLCCEVADLMELGE